MAKGKAGKRRLAKRQQRPPGVHSEMLLNTSFGGATIRIVRWTLMPGECTPPFPHPPHCIAIIRPINAGQVERVIRQGRKRLRKTQKLVAGQPYMRFPALEESFDQSVCNTGDGPIMFEKCIICWPGGIPPGIEDTTG